MSVGTFVSGGMLMLGTVFFVDVLEGTQSESAFDQIGTMLNNEFKLIIITGLVLSAYVVGIINFMGSSVVFRKSEQMTSNELLLVNNVESLQKSQVLKEFVELLQMKRMLIAFIFPLAFFGLSIAVDYKEVSFGGHMPRIVVGVTLVLLGFFGWYCAMRMSRLLYNACRKIMESNKAR